MKILVPQLLCNKVDESQNRNDLNGAPKSAQEQDENAQYDFKAEDFQPQHESHSLHKLHEFNMMKSNDHPESATWYNEKYRTFTDKPPTWNPKCNAYVYNFRGRVSQASIKNF